MKMFAIRKFRSIVVSSVLLLSGCSWERQAVEPPLPSFEHEVDSFRPVEPVRWQLSNGLTVFYLEDNELPLVKGKLFMRGGSLWVPADRSAAIGAMGDQLRQGGAGKLDADQLDLELEKLAASVSSSFGAEFGSISFSCLSDDLDRVFGIFADVLLKPRFNRERLVLWKGQALEGIRRRVEDPGTVATLSYQQLLYRGTPYGRVVTEQEVSRVDQTVLQSLHKEFVRPNGAILVITGRVPREKVAQLVTESLGGWAPRENGELPPAPPIPQEPTPGIYFVKLPFAQTTVQMGQLGVPRLTPDHAAIDVFNEVFGSGGFGSRLMKRIRTELGLSYGTYGGIAPGAVRGSNYIFIQTKAESTADAIKEGINVLTAMQSEAVSTAELDERKRTISKSFIFNFDSPESVIARRARLELLKFPQDFDATYLSKIEAVGPIEVEEVSKSRWDVKKFVVVVVGNDHALEAVQKMMKAPPPSFEGMPLHQVTFESRLLLPDL